MGNSILAWLSSRDPHIGQYGNAHVLICIYTSSDQSWQLVTFNQQWRNMTTCYFQPVVPKHDNVLLSTSSDETWQLVTFNQQWWNMTTCYFQPAGTAYPSGAPEFTPVVSGVRVIRSLVLCVCFVDRCFSFCTFSFGHCVVCSSSICGFWLPIWHLQTFLLVIVLSVLLLFDLRLLITPLASPNFSFGYCVVCSSSI